MPSAACTRGSSIFPSAWPGYACCWSQSCRNQRRRPSAHLKNSNNKAGVRADRGVVGVKILFLSDNFPPEVNAPASRTYEHCRYWAGLGHDVTVVTCAPNFPKGRVFPGYTNRLWHSEMVDGV